MGTAIFWLIAGAPIPLVAVCAYRTIAAPRASRRLRWAAGTTLIAGLYAALLLALSTIIALGHAFFVEFPNVDVPVSEQHHDPTLRHVADVLAAGFWGCALVAVLAAIVAVVCLVLVSWR